MKASGERALAGSGAAVNFFFGTFVESSYPFMFRTAWNEAMAKEGVLVKDPVCGTYVSRDSDIRIKDGGEVRCFCSYECRDKYLKELQS